MNMLEILSGMCYSEKDRGEFPCVDRSLFQRNQSVHKRHASGHSFKTQETWNCPGNNTGSGTASSCAACVGKRSRL